MSPRGRRLLSPTIHEAIACDGNLDSEGCYRVMNEARGLICDMYGLNNDAIGRAETERFLADAKVKLLRKLGESVPADRLDSEEEAAADEESAATLVSVALPAERRRILDLLELFRVRGEQDAGTTQGIGRPLGRASRREDCGFYHVSWQRRCVESGY